MEKVFRDPVHNLMRFDTDRDRLILTLIDTAEVQRLRNIRQMGVSDLIFPGATHTRFSHALGTTFLMKRVLERMELLRKDAQHAKIVQSLDEHREILLAAGLLHDLGHFPYSHLMEEALQIDHEAWSIHLIQNPDSQVNQVLADANPQYPARVAKLLRRTFKPSYAVKLISSQLDVDRLDYLIRDSLNTGVGYGRFDLDWLLHSLRIVEAREDYEIAVDEDKGLQVAESYVLARYYMYRQVYHHRLERAAGVLLLKLLQRARVLFQENRLQQTPKAVQKMLIDPKGLNREDFLHLDDVRMGYAIGLWQASKDAVLSDLCRRFLSRDLFKTVPLSQRRYEAIRSDLNALAKRAGFDSEYYLKMDTVAVNLYQDPYLAYHSKEASESLFVVDPKGTLCDLSEKSKLIQTLRNQPLFMERLCYPAEIQSEILTVLEASG